MTDDRLKLLLRAYRSEIRREMVTPKSRDTGRRWALFGLLRRMPADRLRAADPFAGALVVATRQLIEWAKAKVRDDMIARMTVGFEGTDLYNSP